MREFLIVILSVFAAALLVIDYKQRYNRLEEININLSARVLFLEGELVQHECLGGRFKKAMNLASQCRLKAAAKIAREIAELPEVR